jgi:DNA-binding NarL/FixJ family response regulator
MNSISPCPSGKYKHEHKIVVAHTVLVVDDYEPFRQLVCSVLERRAEFQIIGRASDGLEAVQKAEELQPDLILLDLGLPKLNGLETTRRIQKLVPLARIVVVSQEHSADVVLEALSLGALGYVHKPRINSDLLPAIEAVLAGGQFVSMIWGFPSG